MPYAIKLGCWEAGRIESRGAGKLKKKISNILASKLPVVQAKRGAFSNLEPSNPGPLS
jgi:hypothetical protein